ncbi:MAG: hypothetical protein U0168_29575 [Nannocystaceae bacterium]|jgi:hypothetical protein
MTIVTKLLFGSLLAVLGANADATTAADPLDPGAQAVPASVTGNCKSVELEFRNDGTDRIDIPQSGHRMRNKGSVEGWNKLTLGASKNGIKAGESWSNVLTLSIKCVEDAEFEIHWSDGAGGDHVKTFTAVNITDKKATFGLK